VILEKSIIRGDRLPEIFSLKIEYPEPLRFSVSFEGGSPANSLPFGGLMYFTGYFRSSSKSFLSEFRYQKPNERKRKKIKTTISLFRELSPFFLKFFIHIPGLPGT